MTYATSLAITARSAWSTWYECSATATRYTEVAIDWYIATFFSQQARRNYEIIGEIIGMLMVFMVQLAIKTHEVVQSWVGAQVESALEQPATDEPGPAIETALEAAAYIVFVAAEVVALARQVVAVAVEGARWVAPKAAKAIGFALCVNW